MLELSGKYTESCAFGAIYSELVSAASTDGIADNLWQSYPTDWMPDFVDLPDEITILTWGFRGGKFNIKTESTEFREMGSFFWLGSQLSNG